eukprot:EG_transcript_14476
MADLDEQEGDRETAVAEAVAALMDDKPEEPIQQKALGKGDGGKGRFARKKAPLQQLDGWLNARQPTWETTFTRVKCPAPEPVGLKEQPKEKEPPQQSGPPSDVPAKQRPAVPVAEQVRQLPPKDVIPATTSGAQEVLQLLEAQKEGQDKK